MKSSFSATLNPLIKITLDSQEASQPDHPDIITLNTAAPSPRASLGLFTLMGEVCVYCELMVRDAGNVQNIAFRAMSKAYSNNDKS